jgi:hypothetical protein
MYSFGEEAVITGAISTVWQVATDIAGWPSWDSHERKARFEGDFAAGAKGWSKPAGAPAGTFTITAVEPERMWASEAGSRSAACAARTAPCASVRSARPVTTEVATRSAWPSPAGRGER